MKFMICPTCGELLGNKQLIFEEKLTKACDDLGIDFDLISKGTADSVDKFVKERTDIINKLCKRYCCKQHLITCCELVDLIQNQ